MILENGNEVVNRFLKYLWMKNSQLKIQEGPKNRYSFVKSIFELPEFWGANFRPLRVVQVFLFVVLWERGLATIWSELYIHSQFVGDQLCGLCTAVFCLIVVKEIAKAQNVWLAEQALIFCVFKRTEAKARRAQNASRARGEDREKNYACSVGYKMFCSS